MIIRPFSWLFVRILTSTVASVSITPALAEPEHLGAGTALLSAKIAAENIVPAQVTHADPAPLRDGAAQKMRDRVQEYVLRETARKKIWEFVSDRIDQQVTSELKGIYDRLGLSKLGVNEKGFDQAIDAIRGKGIADAKRQFIAQNFDEIFRAARELVVKTQCDQLRRQAYPSEAEVVDAAENDFSAVAKDKLRKSVIDRIKQKLPPAVFEEVNTGAENYARVVMDDIAAQQKMQEQTAAQLVSPELVTRGQIGAYLEDSALSAIRKGSAQPGAAVEPGQVRQVVSLCGTVAKAGDDPRVVYPLLPSVRKMIKQRSTNEEYNRWLEFLRNVSIKIDPAPLAAALNADPQSHREPDASRDIFVRDLSSRFVDQAFRTRLAQASKAPDFSDFQHRLDVLIKQDNQTQIELRKAVISSLGPVLTDLRKSKAGEQLLSHFPALAKGSWPVSEQLILQRIKSQDVPEFTALVQLSNITIGGVSYRSGALLVETEQQVKAAVGDELEQGGLPVFGKQSEIADRQANISLDQVKRAGTKGQNVEDWTKRTTEAALLEWQKVRPSLAPRAGKYAELFPAIKEHIRLKIRDAWPTNPSPEPQTVKVTPPAKSEQISGGGDGKGPGGGTSRAADEGGGAGGGGKCPPPRDENLEKLGKYVHDAGLDNLSEAQLRSALQSVAAQLSTAAKR